MISPDRLAALMRTATPHAVLDLRERGAYETGHIFRSTSLPRRLLEFRLPALVTAANTPIVLCDSDGSLSQLARPTLEAMGYANVRVLAGGLAGWRAAGRPLVEGVNVPSKVFGELVLHERRTPLIAAPELRGRLERGEPMVIVDARTPDEYVRGTVPGAWSVPGGELVLRITDLLPSPETPVVVHCGGRTRSFVGAESLRMMQLPNPVLALENGTMGWLLAGFALERGAGRDAPAPSARSRAVAEHVAERVAAEERIRSMSPPALAQLWARRDRENVYVLDVRPREEFAAGHVPGAIWAPGGQAVQATDDYVAVRDASIVFVCDGSARAVMAAAWFRRMGFPGVSVLAGGIPGWVAAGRPLETRRSPAAPAGWDAGRGRVATVNPAELAAELVRPWPPLVLSVDQSDEYERRHVPDAGWLCRSRLELRIDEAAPDRSRPLVLTCADGFASTLAAATLDWLGYTRVRVLAGGTYAWEAAGCPVERGPTRMLDHTDDVVSKPYEKGAGAMRAYLEWEVALDRDGRSPRPLAPGPAAVPGR